MTESPRKRSSSSRKRETRRLADELATERDQWIERNAYYYEEDRAFSKFLIGEGKRILDLGCGTGQLLASLGPSRGVGVDFSSAMVEIARSTPRVRRL
jgi:ubiquinone/menaquinone biosynthesis C-methylase UbiE